MGETVVFSAFNGDDYVPVIRVVNALGDLTRNAQWIVDADFAGRSPNLALLDEVAATETPISQTDLLDLLAEAQMIEGELRQVAAQNPVVIQSVSGNQFDVGPAALVRDLLIGPFPDLVVCREDGTVNDD